MNIKILAFKILQKSLRTLPYAILISIMMSIGPIIQQIYSKFLLSEESNFYDTLNNGVIVVMQTSFIDWITAYYLPYFIFPSLLIMIFGTMTTNSKKSFFHISLLIFLTLMLTDYFFGIKDENFDFSLNFISNLIGSPFMAAVVLLALDTGYTINHYFENNNSIQHRIINSLIAILYGFAIAFIIYIIDKHLYSVTTSRIDLTMKIPVNGAYITDTTNKKKSDDSYGLFSSPSSNVDKFSWMGFSQDFSFKFNDANHTFEKPSQVYTAEVRVIDECILDKNIITNILSHPPTYIIERLSKIGLTINDGFTNMYIFESPSEHGKLLVSHEGPIPFEIKHSKIKGYDLTRFMLESVQIKHYSWRDKTSYALLLGNIDSSDSSTKMINREINISSENKILEIKLIPNPNMHIKGTEHQLDCKALSKSNDGVYHLNSLFGGVILTLRNVETNTTTFINLDKTNETIIKGLGGWMSANEVNKEELSTYINHGTLNMLHVTAPILKLYIDGTEYKQTTSMPSVYITKAKLDGRITTEGLLEFTGTAKAIYINGHRANQSRWEKLNIAYKLMLFGLIPGLLFFMFKKLRSVLNKEWQYLL